MNIRVSRFLEDQKILTHPQNPTDPLISVVMPTYRLREGGFFNQRAIESVLNQTFNDFEFIIVDDGSLDGLQTLLLEYQQHDSRIVIIRHEINSGLHAVRLNEGIMIARGRYLAYMFEDDEWQPEALERLIEVVQQNNDDCAVYGVVKHIVHRLDGSVEESLLGDWDFNYAMLKNSNKIAHCAILHPRSVLEQCGLYDPHILARRLCDYDLWLRMARFLPFRRCTHVIGKATQGTPHSLGKTIDQDLILTMRYFNTARDSQLLPGIILDYEVDSLDFVKDPAEMHRIRENYIIPFWERHPAILTHSERKLTLVSMPKQNRLLVTKSDYSTSIDVTMGNFNRLLVNTAFSFTYLQERNLGVQTRWNFDTLILFRSISAESEKALEQAHQFNKPVIYMMDDNMFKFGSGYTADDFAYIKPESPGYKILEREVSKVDLVISYSPFITREIQQYNPRVFELTTNIRESIIEHASCLKGGHQTGRKLKYAILSGSARNKEFKSLWGEFQQFAHNHSNEIDFYFYGVDPWEFGELSCPVYHREFNHSYDAYLSALVNEKFDFVITPLFDDHDTKKSKSPIKYLEATVAGAVGIYSDINVYQTIQNDVTGLKISNQPGAWLAALEISFQMKDTERQQMHEAAKNHILQDFTSESQVLKYLSAFEAAQLHRSLDSHTANGGRAGIAYFFHESLLGGAMLHLTYHAIMMYRFGFQPILCFPLNREPDTQTRAWLEQQGCIVTVLEFEWTLFAKAPSKADLQRSVNLREWLHSNDIRFVHMVNVMADVALATQSMGIPTVATLHKYYEAPSPYIINEQEHLISAVHSSSLIYAKRWQSVFDAPAFCIRAPLANKYFELFAKRKKPDGLNPPTLFISGTLQPRKGQKKAIEAVAELAKQGLSIRLVLTGYDNLLQKYVDECRDVINEFNLQDLVTILGFKDDEQSLYETADYILCASDEESFPQSILKGMASGLRVITTPVGGVEELVVDGFSGIVTSGYEVKDLVEAIERAISLPSEHWDKMLENAHNSVQMASSEERVAYKLLSLYNIAVQEKNREMKTVRQYGKSNVDNINRPVSNILGYKVLPIHDFIGTQVIEKRLPNRGVTYRFKCNDDHWLGLKLTFGSHPSTLEGKIEATIRLVNQPQSVLRSFWINLTQINNGFPQDIFFPVIHNSSQIEFFIEFKPKNFSFRQDLFISEKIKSTNLLKNLTRNFSTVGGYLHGDGLFSV